MDRTRRPRETAGTLGDEEGKRAARAVSAQVDARRVHEGLFGQPVTRGEHVVHLLDGVWSATGLLDAKDGQLVRIAGNVICRQRPGTAKGFVFISLEDETGIANAIVAPDLFEKLRLTITQEAYLLIEGWVQIAEGTIHVKATGIEELARDVTPHAESHDFR